MNLKSFGKRQGIFSLFNIKRALVLCAVMFCAMGAWTQTTYTWNTSVSTGSWTDSANWTVDSGTGSTYPGDGTTNDIATFGGSAMVAAPSTFTIGEIQVNNNSTVSISTTGTLIVTTIDGNGNLTIQGNFDSLSSANLGSLTVEGTSTISGNITTSGTQTYTGAVTLNGDTTLTATGQTIEFGSTVQSNDVASANRNLTITAGTIIHRDVIGDPQISGSANPNLRIKELRLTATNVIQLTEGSRTTDLQSYVGVVELIGSSGSYFGLSASGGSNRSISFSSTFEGNDGELNTAGESFSFGGDVSKFTIFTINNTATINGNITTTGNQTYNGEVTVASGRSLNAGSANIDFVNNVTFSGTPSVTADNLIFSRTSGTQTITTGALFTYSGNVTKNGAGRLTFTNGFSETGSGNAVSLQGEVTASANGLNFNGAVTLTEDTTLTAAGQSVSFGSTITSPTTRYALSIGSSSASANEVTFDGDVGGESSPDEQLRVLEVYASNNINIGDSSDLVSTTIRTSEEQIYSGTVVSGGVNFRPGTNISFTRQNDGNILSSSWVNIYTLTGNVTFGNASLGHVIDTGSSVTIEAATIRINVASVLTKGAQTYNGPVTLGENTTLIANTKPTESGGTRQNISFSSTITGSSHSLTLGQEYDDSPAVIEIRVGEVTFSNGVNVATLTVVASATKFTQTGGQSVTTNSAVRITGPITNASALTFSNGVSQTGGNDTITINANITATNGSLRFEGNLFLDDAITLNAATSIILYGNVNSLAGFDNSAVNPTFATPTLTVSSSDTHTINIDRLFTFAGNFTKTDSSLDPSASGYVESHTNFTNGFSKTGSGTTASLEGSIIARAGGLSFAGPISLTDDTTLTAEGSGDINLGSVTSVTRDSHDFSLVAVDDTVTIGYDGVKPATFPTSINCNRLTFTGTTGTQNITFGSPNYLDVTSGFIITEFQLNVGDDRIIQFDSGFTTSKPVDTRGYIKGNNLTFNGNVDLGGIRADFTATGASGVITFGGTVGGNVLTATAPTININGGGVTTSANDAVDNPDPIDDIPYRSGNQTYNGNVVLGGDSTFTINNDSTDTADEVILFNGTVSGAHAVTVTKADALTFNGVISNLQSLTATAGGIAFNATAGNQVSTVTGAVQLNTSGEVSFGNASGDSVTFGSLAFITNTPSSINLAGSLTTTNSASAISFPSEVELTASSTVRSNNGAITFIGAVTNSVSSTFGVNSGNANITFNNAGGNQATVIGGTVTLTSSGTVTFGDSAGDTTSFGSLTFASNPAVNLAGILATTNNGSAISFPAAVTLAQNSEVSSADADITFMGALTGSGALTLAVGAGSARIYFNNASGAQATSVPGVVTLAATTLISFGNDAGDTISFGSFTITTGTLELAGTIGTTGYQTYNCNIILTANTILSAGNGATGGAVTFNGTINSDSINNWSLNIYGSSVSNNAGAVTFGDGTGTDIVGGTDLLSSLSVQSSGITINGGAISTTGAQTYTGPVTVSTTAATLDSSSSGAIDFQNSVALTNALTVNTAGNVEFNGAVTGASNLTVTNSATLSFGSTIGASGANVGGVDLTATTSTTFTDEVYATSLQIDSLSITINGGTVSTENNQTYIGPVSIGTRAATLSTTADGDIDFQNTVALGQNLIVTTGGNVDFDGAVTSTSTRTLSVTNSSNLNFRSTVGSDATRLGATTLIANTSTTFTGTVYTQSVAVNSPAIHIDGGAITTNGVQTYTGAVELESTDSNTTTLTTTNSAVGFIGTIDGADILTIDAGNSTVTFGGAVGGVAGAATNLTNLSVNAARIAINGGSVSTNGNQTYGTAGSGTGDVSIDEATTLTARNASTNDAAISFKNNVTRTGSADFALEVDSNIATFSNTTTAANSPIVFIGDSMTVTYGTHNADIYIDLNSGATMTLGGALDSNNLYFYNGELNLNGKDIETGNFAIFGTNYNATDRGWHVANTRFAYYGYDLLLYKASNLSNATASFADLGTSTIDVRGNFYNNGADMTSTSAWTLNIPDRGAPTSNSGDSPTATQWGTRYAVAFNMTVQNSTAVDGWVAAATGTEGQNVEHTGTNSQWQSESPRLKNVYVTTDRKLNFGFSTNPSNAGDGENASTVKIPSGASYRTELSRYNVGESVFSAITKTGSIITATASGVDNITGDSWNTDTVGTSVNAQSTDRAGNEKAIGAVDSDTYITNDVSLMKGAFYHAQGNTMSRSIGYDHVSGAVELNPTYTDQAHPVLAAVYTGQEAHNPLGAAQLEYDAHNFIELRFSEAVDITSSAVAGSIPVLVDSVNLKATDDFGSIVAPRDNEIRIVGLGSLTMTGRLETGSKDITTGAITPIDNTVHAFYRTFSINGATNPEPQTHRMRISIAGFREDTVPVPGSLAESNYYPGFINNAETPSGQATFAGTPVISEAGGGGLSLDRTNSPTINALLDTDPDADNGLYGEWDTQKPVIARENSNDATSLFEAVGIPDGAGSRVLRFEMHLHDNTPTATNSWERGWNEGKVRLDTAGGSRPDYAAVYPALPASPSTQGGLRASTVVGAESAFSIYQLGTNILASDITSDSIQRYVENDYFAEGIDGLATTNDTLYLSFVPTEQLNPFPRYNIRYDSTRGYITDLAGNRMATADISTSDLVAPEITLTLAPYVANNQQLYVYFNKALDLSGADPAFATLDNIHNAITFFNADGTDSTLSALAGTEIAFQTETATGLIFNLDRPVEDDELFSVYFQPDDETDVLRIRGTNFAPMNTLRQSPVTYFGVNTVYPLNAVGALDFDFSSPPTAGDVTVLNFDGSKGLYAHRDITMEVAVENAVAPLDNLLLSPTLWIDSNAVPLTYAERYLEETGQNITFWMPSYTDPASVFSESYNTGATKFTNPDGSDDRYTFTIGVDDIARSSGDTMQFLFEMGTVKTPNAAGQLTLDSALYHINIPDLDDLQNFSMFAFKVFDETQRGGSTILNNVINVNEKEETLLEVIMPKDGNLNVTVLTADGDVVKVLSRGRKTAGEHYFTWDGTNNAGSAVARGIYFIRVVGPGIDETRKVMAVKE